MRSLEFTKRGVMIPTFFVTEHRLHNHNRDFTVAVWQKNDLLDSAGDPRNDSQISPTIVFHCQGLDDSKTLADRLKALRDALESGRQPDDKSIVHQQPRD